MREAIVNAIAHRDYRQHAYVQVSVLPGRVEVVSPGMLFDGLTKEEMLTGKSKLRNPVLADIFHKMGIIEKWGPGLPRIFARCAKAGVPGLDIAVGESTLTVCFLRRVGNATNGGVADVGNRVGNVGNVFAGYADIEQIVMDSLLDEGKISAAKMAKIAKVTTRTIERALVRLKASGRIRRRAERTVYGK